MNYFDRVEIPITEDESEITAELSDLIKNLPLNTDDNNRLINKLLEYRTVIKGASYLQGFNAALNVEKNG